MMRFILVLAVVGILFQACERVRVKDAKEEEVKKSVEALSAAFNEHDANKLSSLWSQDAYYINLSTEESALGNDNIASYFAKQFSQDENAAESLKIQLSSISFPSADVALAKGLAETTYQDNLLRKTAFIAQYAKENGKWIIQHFSVTELKPPTSHFEQLKNLDWLVGNWSDDDENIDVTYTFEWDKEKNFLTQHFVLSVLGYEELRGMQILGWDAMEKKIRSWTFDSDGGYGQGVWYEDDNTWYATVNFTMPQGGHATATHVLKKIDDHTFTFASVGREVNGNLLPNIGPFTVIKKK